MVETCGNRGSFAIYSLGVPQPDRKVEKGIPYATFFACYVGTDIESMMMVNRV